MVCASSIRVSLICFLHLILFLLFSRASVCNNTFYITYQYVLFLNSLLFCLMGSPLFSARRQYAIDRSDGISAATDSRRPSLIGCGEVQNRSNITSATLTTATNRKSFGESNTSVLQIPKNSNRIDRLSVTEILSVCRVSQSTQLLASCDKPGVAPRYSTAVLSPTAAALDCAEPGGAAAGWDASQFRQSTREQHQPYVVPCPEVVQLILRNRRWGRT